MKSIGEINEKLKRGEAVVLTAQEFKASVRKGKQMSPNDVDVVTTATFGVMSGTAALLSIPVAERGEFKGAREVYINDVPAFPGPCPNESLGLVEAMLYGTMPSRKDPKRYGGGHALHDLVSGKEVTVDVTTNEGNTFTRRRGLRDLELAQMVTTRSCFKNYMAIVNTRESTVSTIFSALGLRGPYQEVTISGCGELNPIENDPHLKTIGVGTRVLLNGSIGYVTGRGTRSTPERPNLALCGDLKTMRPDSMGGFITSHSPDTMISVAIPIPVINEESLENLTVLDEQIELPIVDIHDRLPVGTATYADVWQKTSGNITFDRRVCETCRTREGCPVEAICPSGSFTAVRGLEPSSCYACGACTFACPHGALRAYLGEMAISGRNVPVTLRQSCRSKAERIAEFLKKLLTDRSFTLAEKLAPLHPHQGPGL